MPSSKPTMHIKAEPSFLDRIWGRPVTRAEVIKEEPVIVISSVPLARPGDVLRELQALDPWAQPSEAQIEAVLEAGRRCGLELKPWQARHLASAAMVASSQLSWPAGESVLRAAKLSAMSPAAAASPSAPSAATPRTSAWRGVGPGRSPA